MEKLIIDKLKETIYLIRLSTGEILIGFMPSQQENFIVVGFPYEIENELITKEFCPISANRNFYIGKSAIQFVKRPKDEFIEIYLDLVLKNNLIEFKSYIKEFSENLIYNDDIQNLNVDRVLH